MSGPGDKKPGPSGQLDLNNLVHRGELEVSIKPIENEHDGRARRSREMVTFTVAVTMVAIVFLTCSAVLLFGSPSVDEQRWLQSAVTLILGAAVGAAFKKS